MRWFRPTWLCLTLACAAGLSAAPAPADPFPGTVDIELGDRVRTGFTGSAGEVHHFSFKALEGTTVTLRVKTDSGTTLDPGLNLLGPGGTQVRGGLESRRSKGRKTEKSFRLLYSGVFVAQVWPKSGTGSYSIQVKGRRSARLDAIINDAGAGGEYRFAGIAGASFVARLRGRRPNAGRGAPRVVGLTDPLGIPVPIEARKDGRVGTMESVVLPRGGMHTLSWENSGGARDLKLVLKFKLPERDKRSLEFDPVPAIARGAADTATPPIAARAGYVGSAACGKCHTDIHDQWSRTAHNLAVREWNRPGRTGVAFTNDADGNGTDDFKDGRDFAGMPGFEDYGADAPRLSYDASAALPYKMTIGAVTYDVERTAGGNGLWRQQYLARIGRALYVLPLEYDETTGEYQPYDPGDWWDDEDEGDGEARYDTAASVPPDLSFEAKCAGCHSTGLEILYDAGTDELLAGFVESSVGCEQCHGPGEEHAKVGDAALIANPRALLDGTPAGVAAANETCNRCHTRGEAVDVVPGTQIRPRYGYDATSGVQQFGDSGADFLTPTTDPDDFWSPKSDPFPATPGGAYAASRRHRQQALDIVNGAHAPRSGFSAACFDCHDAHSAAMEHMLAQSINRGVAVTTRLEDNSFCLACHAGVPGPFEDVDKEDVAALSTGATAQSIVDAAVRHMTDIGMPTTPAAYAPETSRVGRCDTCHMPHTATATSFTADAAGHAQGDHRSHTFAIVWPNLSADLGVTDSCSACHNADNDPVKPILTEWATRGSDGDDTYHADTPRSFQNGTRNPDNGSGGVRCVSCHTTEGFIRIQVEGETLDQAEVDAVLESAIAHDHGITCQACHGLDADGEFAPDPNPLRFPAADICGRCHNAGTLTFDDFNDTGEIIRHPQREMIDGTAGSEVPGSGGYGNTVHSLSTFFPDNCVSCHFDSQISDESHDFQPRVETCHKCHDDVDDSFDRPAFGDYDGSGEIEGIQTEVDGLLQAITDALLMDPEITFSNGRFEYGGATDGKMTGASEAQKRGAHNYYSVVGDASRGIHNAVRTVQLLQRSYEEIVGSPLPGADLR